MSFTYPLLLQCMTAFSLRFLQFSLINLFFLVFSESMSYHLERVWDRVWFFVQIVSGTYDGFSGKAGLGWL